MWTPAGLAELCEHQKKAGSSGTQAHWGADTSWTIRVQSVGTTGGEELRSQEHCGLTPSLLSAEDRGLSCLRPPAICDTELHRMPTWLPLPDANKESHPPGSDTQRGSDQFCWKPRSLVAAKDACTILLSPSVSFSSYVTGHMWRVKLQTQSQRPGARAHV